MVAGALGDARAHLRSERVLSLSVVSAGEK